MACHRSLTTDELVLQAANERIDAFRAGLEDYRIREGLTYHALSNEVGLAYSTIRYFLYSKEGITLKNEGRIEDAIASYNDVISRFDKETITPMAEACARAYWLRGTIEARRQSPTGAQSVDQAVQRLTELPKAKREWFFPAAASLLVIFDLDKCTTWFSLLRDASTDESEKKRLRIKRMMRRRSKEANALQNAAQHICDVDMSRKDCGVPYLVYSDLLRDVVGIKKRNKFDKTNNIIGGIFPGKNNIFVSVRNEDGIPYRFPSKTKNSHRNRVIAWTMPKYLSRVKKHIRNHGPGKLVLS